MGVMRPELVMKSIVPVVMAGVLGIYGLIIAVIISTGSEYVSAFIPESCRVVNLKTMVLTVLHSFTVTNEGYTLFQGYAHLAAGLSCGLAGLAAGMAIGIVGDSGVRCDTYQLSQSYGSIQFAFERKQSP